MGKENNKITIPDYRLVSTPTFPKQLGSGTNYHPTKKLQNRNTRSKDQLVNL
jgi:hypothetical protein